MEHGDSLLSTQDPAIGPCPEPDDSSPHFHVLKTNFYILLPSMPKSCKWSFSSSFLTKIFYTFLISPIFPVNACFALNLQRFYPSLLSRDEHEDEMAVCLKALQTKLEEVSVELQKRKGSL
jgi:hypothetical protein